MKTNRLLHAAFIILLLAVVARLAYNHNLWNIRGVEPSKLYLRYEHADGIKASFIKDYRINDTLTLDVTLLQATDSAGWDSLKSYYEFSPTLSDKDLAALADGHDLLKTFINVNDNKTNLPDNEILVASLRDKYICIFHMKNLSERDLLFDQIMDKIFNSLKVNEKIVHQ